MTQHEAVVTTAVLQCPVQTRGDERRSWKAERQVDTRSDERCSWYAERQVEMRSDQRRSWKDAAPSNDNCCTRRYVTLRRVSNRTSRRSVSILQPLVIQARRDEPRRVATRSGCDNRCTTTSGDARRRAAQLECRAPSRYAQRHGLRKVGYTSPRH